MSVSLKGCKFEHTELSIHFESFNDERSQGRKSVESGIKTNVCKLNWCLLKSTNPVLKRILFQYPKVDLQPLIF